jgi:DNA-binding SARP family transcriptional activator/LysM repeat protein
MIAHGSLARSRPVVRGAAAFVALAALVVGVPVGLVLVVGWPLPHHLLSASAVHSALTSRGLSDRVLLDTLACVAWLAWASATSSVAAEVVAVARGHASRRIGVGAVFQPVVGRLVAAVLLAVLSFSRPQPASPVPSRQSLASQLVPASVVLGSEMVQTTPSANGSLAAARVQATESSAPGTPASPATTTYTVVRHDTLWSIAEAKLGNPLKWKQIFALNEGRPQPDGQTLADPHWIYPGWVLTLPAASSSAPDVSAATPPTTGALETPTPTAPIPSVATSTHTQNADHAETSPGAADGAPHHAAGTSRPAPIALPSGSVVAASFAAGVLSAVAVGWRRRRHSYRPRAPAPIQLTAAPPLADTLQALATLRSDRRDCESDSADELGAAAYEPATVDSFRAPGRIEIGTQQGDPVFLDLMTPSGISVGGRGANEVVRAWCSAVLVQAGIGRFELLSTATTGAALFPGLHVAPAIRLAEGSDDLLRCVDTEVISRRRRLFESGTPDIVSYREAHPEDPVASLIVVIDSLDGPDAERSASMLATLESLDIGVLILGPDGHAAIRISVDADRTVTAKAGDSGEPTIGAQLHGLTGVEASELLVAVIGSTEEPEPEAAVTDEAVQRSPSHAMSERTAPEIGALRVRAANDRPRPIEIKILGQYRIVVNGEEIAKGLRSAAKELLAWYLIRPQGATAEAAVDALWPNTDPALMTKRFWLALGNLRPRLREPSGMSVTDVIFKSGDRYLPDAQAIDCDLWAFERHLVAARSASGDAVAHAALRQAVDAYGGEFAEGLDYLWAEGMRQDLHQRALDAHLRLAELEMSSNHLQAAAEILSRAVQFGGCAEEPSRRLMILQNRLGQPDALASTWRSLQRQLADLGLHPESETVNLYRELIEGDETERRLHRSR